MCRMYSMLGKVEGDDLERITSMMTAVEAATHKSNQAVEALFSGTTKLRRGVFTLRRDMMRLSWERKHNC